MPAGRDRRIEAAYINRFASPGDMAGPRYSIAFRYSFGETPSSFLNTLLKYFSS